MQIIKADALARERFTYQADVGRDTWRSSADRVRAGQSWSGDCDDLVSTVLDLLHDVPLNRRFRVEVDSRGGNQVDHLIGCVVDDEGKFWIVGDTFRPAYPAGECRHRPIEYQRMDLLDVIRQGAPWST